MTVPIERVRYSDGRRYVHEEHHFLFYYRRGTDALRLFYEKHQPSDVFEYFWLQSPDHNHVSRPSDVPWFEHRPPNSANGEFGLGLEHGNQAYGPVSEEKVQLEAQRLDGVMEGILAEGFRPEVYGYPRGYFMLRRTGEWVFTIRSGFHRTAAVAHLGYRELDVQYYQRYSRFVEEADCDYWPMVRSGILKRAEALAIFNRFFDPVSRVAMD